MDSVVSVKAVVLESPIDVLSWDAALQRIDAWSRFSESRYVCLCNVHTIVAASRDSAYRTAINNADMTLPDGMPVAWYMRAFGVTKQQRIDGPELMWRLCESVAASSQRVFLYGSSPRVLKRLTANLKRLMPTLQIAGTHSPPYRALTADEDKVVIELINATGAAVVFVALGCPKQELWMAQHRGKIRAVMVGVGAAFEFHAGTLRRAPTWMQEMGLEWLFRLAQEPKRLWRRYLLSIPIFLFLVATHLMRNVRRLKVHMPLPPR